MKKLFTFFVAALFATSMFAQSTEKSPSDPASVTTDQALVGTSYTIPAAQVAGGGSKIIGDMWDKGVKVRTNKKHGDISNALPFLVNEGKQINSIKIVGVTNKDGVSATFSSVIVDGTTISISGSLPSKDGSASGVVEIKDIEAKESVIFVSDGNGGQALICYEITYDDATPSTDPVLNVDKESVELNALISRPAPKAEVTFSGKNLAAGKYALVVPNLADLSVDPAEVEVGEDGKLNAKVVITFAPKEDVAAGSTKISLTIGELTKEVAIAYSASFVKDYEYATSVNIEQWVLDNGKDNETFHAVLEAANIEFADINELDSLNDEKDLRNEPYLGLKLKKQGARVACWVKAGDRIAVKFGMRKDAVIIGVNGEYNELEAGDAATSIDRTAEQDEYLEIITKSASTIVLKQIMINQDIAEVVLPAKTAVDNTVVDVKATKRIQNGQVIIEKNGATYNVLGAEVK
ncbi:MAG: hypothetical protein J6P74_04500 [Paludibacteraceae bacterium]|nr:hypothetical protein [Paludibacteraceae bacterium]